MKLLHATYASETLAQAHAASEKPRAIPSSGSCPVWMRTVIRRSVGDWMWHVRDDFLAILDELKPDAWLSLSRVPGATLIKENDGRQVWQIRTPAGEVFAKVYTAKGLLANAKRWVRGPACLAEWRVASYAREHDLPTVEPIACSYRRLPWGGADCLLITSAIPNAVPLNEYWNSLCRLAEDAQRRRAASAIINAVADLIATAHQAGFHHVDLHAGNLLVVDDDAARPPRVVFVDLHGVRIGRAVSDIAVVRNLAQLNQWFRRHAGITHRIRFLHRYMETRAAMRTSSPYARSLGLSFRELVAALDERARAHACELYAQRDRRTTRTNKYFARIRIPGGWRGHVFLCAKHPVAGSRASTTVFSRRQWESWLADPLRWVRADGQGSVLKNSHSAIICRLLLPTEPEPLAIVCKRPRARNLKRRLSLLLRESRNFRTWRRGYALINRELATARPLAVLERRRFGLRTDSILITEALPNARDLDVVLSADLSRLSPRAQRRAKDLLIDRLSDLVKRLDARGFVHRDFKASNILVQWDEGWSTPPKLCLVDLDGLRLTRGTARPPTPAAIRAIARLEASLDGCLTVTQSDRVRFLKLFLSGWGRDASNWKDHWRRIHRLAAAARSRHERHRAWKLRHYGRA